VRDNVKLFTQRVYSMRNEDTPENREFWDVVRRAVVDWDAQEPEWSKRLRGAGQSSPFEVHEHNILDVLTKRFRSGDPGSGLVLDCNEAHALMAALEPLRAERRSDPAPPATKE
jgi:hypothetical protein